MPAMNLCRNQVRFAGSTRYFCYNPSFFLLPSPFDFNEFFIFLLKSACVFFPNTTFFLFVETTYFPWVLRLWLWTGLFMHYWLGARTPPCPCVLVRTGLFSFLVLPRFLPVYIPFFYFGFRSLQNQYRNLCLYLHVMLHSFVLDDIYICNATSFIS